MEAGGENRWRASAWSELQDIAVRKRTGFRHEEITGGVKGQAPSVSKPASEDAPDPGGSEFVNCVCSWVAKQRICQVRHRLIFM